MKQIEVRILQQSYLLTCPQGHEQRLLDAVERVDSAMTRIRDAGKVRARERIAVLAALNLAFEVSDREAARQEAAGSAAEQPVPPADSVEVEASAPLAAPATPAPGLFDQGALPLEDGPARHAPTEAQADTQHRIDALLQRLDHALDGGARA